MYFTTHQVPSRSVVTSEGEMLFFSGTAYLGMPPDTHLQALVQEGMQVYGANYGVSRTSNMRLAIFEESENYLCQLTGAAAALTLSSGYMAGQLLVRRLRELYPQAQFRYAPYTHPAVFLEGYAYAAIAFEKWAEQILEEIESQPTQKFILVADTVNTIYGKINSFDFLKNIQKNPHTTLVIDDSHSFGVLGKDGLGAAQIVPDVDLVEKIIISSLSKASGIPAGFILCTPQLKHELMENGFFRGSSPANPAYLYAFCRLKNIYAQKREQLWQNIAYLGQKLDKHKFSFSQNYPIFYTPQAQLYDFLCKKGIIISSFPYPKSDGDIITRIIVSALHTFEDLDILAQAVDEFEA